MANAGELIARIDERALMHATLGPVFSHDDWIFELKMDGYRALGFKLGREVRLMSRLGNSLSARFPEVVASLAQARGDFVVDGELAIVDAYGRCDFNRLASRGRLSRPLAIEAGVRQSPAVLWTFDVLILGDRDLRRRPLNERKTELKALATAFGPHARAMTWIVRDGEALFAAVAKLHQEGIVAKKADSPYLAGRSLLWRKIKLAGYSRARALDKPS
jgi:bifunctional non-homologous end joining protein LigD